MEEVTVRKHLQKSILKSIPIESLRRGRYQPRTEFPEESLDSLAETINKFGILEPILVRPLSSHGTYEIIAGERRWRAAQRACLAEVPCLVGLYTDEEASQISLIENISRENLNPIEEAMAFSRIIEEFGYTREEVRIVLGKKNRSEVTNKLRLLTLDSRVQDMLITGELQEGHGKTLAGLDVVHQFNVAKQCVDNQWSMRKMEKVIKDFYSSAKKNKGGAASAKKDANIANLERNVSDAFGHKVEFDWKEGSKSGFVKIGFRDLEQFDLIIKRLGYKKDRFD